jgi:hypothetical protein
LIFTSANDSVQVAGSGAATAAATKPGRAVTDTRTQH